MSWTDLDTVCTIGAGFFGLWALALFVYLIVLCCDSSGPSLERRVYNESVLLYAISATILGLSYLFTTDYVGQGRIEYANPCNSSRDTVIWAWALGDLIAFALWNWPLMIYLDIAESFDIFSQYNIHSQLLFSALNIPRGSPKGIHYGP